MFTLFGMLFFLFTQFGFSDGTASLSGFNLPGGEIGPNITASQFKECDEQCEKNPNCTYFSFDVNAKQCQLKQGDAASLTAEKVPPRQTLGILEKRIKSSTGIMKIQSCGWSPVKRGGNSQSATDCEKKCRADPKCTFYNYQVARKHCYNFNIEKFVEAFSTVAAEENQECGFFLNRFVDTA